MFLEISQNSQENTCDRFSFLIKLQAIKKETLTQVFSCEFLEISKNTFITENFRATASAKPIQLTWCKNDTSRQDLRLPEKDFINSRKLIAGTKRIPTFSNELIAWTLSKLSKSKLTTSQWRLRRLRSKTTTRVRENQNHKSNLLGGHATLKVGASCTKSPPWQAWWQ